jgi:hypothetical protein
MTTDQDTRKFADGFYHLYSPIEPEPVLVQHYFSTDAGKYVFGFNTHDGGGMLPVDDLTKETVVKPVHVSERIKLTNLDISQKYRDFDYYLMKKDFTAALAFWLVNQSPYDSPDITKAVEAFGKFVDVFIFGEDNPHLPKKFTYEELRTKVSEDAFVTIPEIEIFNHSKIDDGAEFVFVTRFSQPDPDYDFIDLGALARNVFYTILRNYILDSTIGSD